jgi:hypothetical protein
MAIFEKPAAPAGFTYAIDGLGKATNVLTSKISSAAANASALIQRVAATSPVNFKIPSFGADTNGPTLYETMQSVKSGAINADITAGLSKISNVASSLPASVSSALAEQQAAIAEKMAAAQAQLPKLLAVAQANMDLTVKMAIAQTGKPPSEEQLKAASGALAIFQDGPKLLNEQAESISKSIAAAGPSFSSAISSATDFAKVGLEKATSLATQAGSAVTGFFNSVPSETIDDPENPGLSIPNPDFTSFAALPENAAKLSSLSSLTSSVSSLAVGLTSSFAVIEEKAAAALAGGIADLKAFAFAAQLAQPATGIMATVKSASVDLSKVSAAQISKTIEMASKVKVSTPPADAENNGTATVETKIPETSTSLPPPKIVIFGKSAGDKISESFRTIYYNSLMTTKALVDALKASAPQDLDAFYPGYSALKAKKLAIEKETPDAATRTAADTAIVTEYTNARKLVNIAVFWKTWTQTVAIYNAGSTEYNILNGLFKADKTYGDVPMSVEYYIKVTSQTWDNSFDGWYSTFKDYVAAHPEEDFSWSSNV